MKRQIILLVAAGVLVLLWMVVAPPRIVLNVVSVVDPSAAVGESLVADAGCRECHRIDGVGALNAPDLSGVTSRLSSDELVARLRGAAGPAMPNPRLSDSEIEAVILYLTELDQPEVRP